MVVHSLPSQTASCYAPLSRQIVPARLLSAPVHAQQVVNGSPEQAVIAHDQEKDQQQAVLSSRRRMILMGCACCSSLFTDVQQPKAAQANEGSLFTYGEESGPLSWGGTCSTGTQQSPINLPRRSTTAAAGSCSGQPAPVFGYRKNNKVRVKNTGTTIQVNFEPGNTVSWGECQLELLQYHFHTPSEHAFDGQRSAMEAHLVHRNKTTGGFVVLGVLLQSPKSPQTAGANPCLAQALANVPSTPQAETVCPASINPLQLLPSGAAARQFVHYSGSLTTPPCSEQVDWLVWEQPLPIPDQQVLEFMLFTGAGKTYGHNARPLQPSNGRSLEYTCLST